MLDGQREWHLPFLGTARSFGPNGNRTNILGRAAHSLVTIPIMLSQLLGKWGKILKFVLCTYGVENFVRYTGLKMESTIGLL